MKKLFLPSAFLAAILFFTQLPAFSQSMTITDDDTTRANDEIVIRPKNDKDGKITIEIKDGKTFLNGKPLSSFEDDHFSVERRKSGDGEAVTVFAGPDFGGPGAFNESFGNGFSEDRRKPLNPNRALLGVITEKGNEPGAVVKKVSTGSAAEKAGLKEGDIITRVDEITIGNPDDLVKAIGKYKPETKAVVAYTREGKSAKVTVTLGALKDDYKYNYNFRFPNRENFNFRVPGNDLAPRVWGWPSPEPKLGIKAQDTEEGNGVKVLDIDDDSPADKAGLKEGDIITSFDGKAVTNVSQLADLAREGKGKASFSVQYNRDGKSNQTEVKIPKKLKTADL
jgi:serine protease Do